MPSDPSFTDWGSPHNAGQIPPEWLQQIVAYLVQHPLPGSAVQSAGAAGQGVTGTVNGDGSVPDGSGVGFTVTHPSAGTYTLTFEEKFSGLPDIQLTPGIDGTGASYTSRTTTTIGVRVFDTRTGVLINEPFSFLAQAPRT